MKKLLIVILVSILNIFFINNISFSASDDTNCIIDFEEEGSTLSIWQALDWCLSDSNLVNWADAKIDWKFWDKIKNWVNNISLYLWIFAIWSIVFWWLMMTLSSWEEEKVNKAKDIIKWGMLWFIWLISASAIINLVVKIMYSL